MNIIQKFKQKRNLSKFLNGGSIPKLQMAWQPLYTDQQRAAIEWGRQNKERTSNQISSAIKQADERIAQRQKAYKRANRKTKAPMINNTAKLQEALYKAGFFDQGTTFNKAVDGDRGGMTDAAIQRAKDAGYNVNIDAGTISNTPVSKTSTSKTNQFIDDGSFSSNLIKFSKNMAANKSQALIDGALYLADRLGVPSNATNYLRDFNVSIPYRIKSGIQGGINTLINGKSFSENYQNALANPGFLTRLTTINPLTNNEGNFSNDEMNIIREMAGDKSYITNSDIRRVGGRYGAAGSVGEYFSPVKIVQTAIGQTSGRNGTLTDLFDVNTISDEAKHDNQMYLDMASENPGANYQTLRATMPYLNMIDIIPNKYKVHSNIKLK